jgi:hypothetical protein
MLGEPLESVCSYISLVKWAYRITTFPEVYDAREVIPLGDSHVIHSQPTPTAIRLKHPSHLYSCCDVVDAVAKDRVLD